MTQQEITECNKLLAKFDSRMRFKNDRKNHAEWVGVVRGEIGNAFMSDQLKYHKSWEWIMPVWFEMQKWHVKKYGMAGVRFVISQFKIAIYTDNDDAYKHICVFDQKKENDMLTEVWTACAGFVKWLYENKKQNWKEMKTTKTNAAVKETGEAQTDGKKRITAYAWSYDNTWIITRDKKQVMPMGSHLFAILDCIATNDDIRTKSTYPTVGDVVSDSKGQKLLIEGYQRIIKK